LDILKKVQKILFGLTSASSQQRQRNLAKPCQPQQQAKRHNATQQHHQNATRHDHDPTSMYSTMRQQ
tara:strand:- start:216 stop:416 length:201 start_codon:yes stop_codon:yes gene_type:complete